MDNIEKVKKILGEFHLKLEHIDDPYITKISSGHTDWLIDNFARQICPLIEQARQEMVEEIADWLEKHDYGWIGRELKRKMLKQPFSVGCGGDS